MCASNAGGHFAPELKFAGFDALIVSGRATEPVYLWIRDGRCEIKPAGELWGRTTGETEHRIRGLHGDSRIRVAAIGPAGEKLVRGACIMVDRGRAAGRGGAGAVMGSKNLKAVAVRGTGSIYPAHPEEFHREALRCRRKLLNAKTVEIYRAGGSMKFGGAGGPTGDFPQAVRNYSDEYWPKEKSRKIFEPALKEDFEIRRLGCFNCASISCSHYYAVSEGPYAGSAGEGIQINSARAFGSNLDIDYAPFILAAHNYCSEAGLDVDVAGACLGWAFEAYARGHITAGDTGGLELNWGDHRAAMKLLESMVRREGFGNTLAEGVKRAAEQTGAATLEYALQVKGADLNEASMRPYKAWSLGIVLSTHGGGHLDGSPPCAAFLNYPRVAEELFGNPRPNAAGDYANQARAVSWFESYKGVVDMLGLCYFTSMWLDAEALSLDDYAILLEKGTGDAYTAAELLKMGGQLHGVQKAFNTLHAGFSRRDDAPPPKLAGVPAQSGPCAGEYLNRAGWDRMLDEYYREKGWDLETGWQTEAHLRELELEDVADRLRRHG